jgi:hypothetical protein
MCGLKRIFALFDKAMSKCNGQQLIAPACASCYGAFHCALFYAPYNISNILLWELPCLPCLFEAWVMMAPLCQPITCSLRQLQIGLFHGYLLIAVASASGCYYSANDTILSSPDYVSPCGTSSTSRSLNCCVVQSGNVCLSESICYAPGSNNYYLSPCTDPTYSAPECPLYCSKSL